MGTLSAPVMFRGLNVWQSDKRVTQTEDMVSVCFLLALLLGGSSRLSLFGLQVGMTFAAFLTVGAGFYLGSGAGTLMGMLGGISLAAQGYPLDLAVGLGAGRLLAGLTHKRESAPLSAFAFGVGCGTVLLLSGRLRVGWTVHCLLGAAALALYPPKGRTWLRTTFQRMGAARRLAEDQYAALLLTRWEHTMEEMAAQVPGPRSESAPHDPAWWRGRLCAGCPLEAECDSLKDRRSAAQLEEVWQHRRDGEERFLEAMEGLRGLGCSRLSVLRERMASLRREDNLRCAAVQRAVHERNMVRTHLMAAAGAAKKPLAEISTGEDWWEAAMIRKVQSALGERSFPAELLFARRLQGRACLGFRETTNLPVSRLSDQLRTLLKEEAGLTLEPPRQEEGVLIYEETPRWHVDAGWAARALAEDADNTGNGDADFNDASAGRTLSRGCSRTAWGMAGRRTRKAPAPWSLMRLCLQAGYTVEQTLTAVNGMMLAATQGEEYATVDLLLADLWMGQAELHKLGACMSVLVYEGRDSVLEGAALPLGILEEIAPQKASFRLKVGQQLFLMSDGITDVMTEEELRAACVEAAQEPNAEAAAALLLQTAVETVDVPHDDASCAVIRII